MPPERITLDVLLRGSSNIMNRCLAILVCGFLGFTAPGCMPAGITTSVAPDSKPTRTIAVLDFDWTPPKAPEKETGIWVISLEHAGQAVADQVATLIVGVPGYNVLERTALRRILQEHDLTATGIVERGNYKEVSALLGADSVVVGQVTAYSVGGWGPFAGCTAAFGARMVDADTGMTLWVLNGSRERGGLQPGMCVAEMISDIRPHFHAMLKRNRPKVR